MYGSSGFSFPNTRSLIQQIIIQIVNKKTGFRLNPIRIENDNLVTPPPPAHKQTKTKV